MVDFQLSLFKGNIFKELVKALFEKAQYVAIPYGYENPYSNIKSKVVKSFDDCSETALRIRHSPDLLIFDEDKGDVKLVEVKMSSYKTPQINRIEIYKKYWNDAIIVFVVPAGNVFFAEEIDKLGIKAYYDLRTDFKKVQEVFPRLQSVDLTEYQKMAFNLLKAITNRDLKLEDN